MSIWGAKMARGYCGPGTSAARWRLIQGGLKYRETGGFRLVAQSTPERNLLLRNAPHCVEPPPTVITIFFSAKRIGAALRALLGSATRRRAVGARSRGAVAAQKGPEGRLAGTDYTFSELDRALRNEQVHHLADLVQRRRPRSMTGSPTVANVTQRAEIAADASGRSAAQRAEEVAAIHALAESHRGRL